MGENILMIGADSNAKGGVSSVIKQFERVKWEYNVISLKTYIDANSFIKIVNFILSVIKLIWYLSFKSISLCHIHMSSRGSFMRKYIIFIICKMFNKKVIVHIHGAQFDIFYNEANMKLKNRITYVISNADKVIVLGEKWKKFILTINENAKVIILNNSININKNVDFEYEKRKIILFLGELSQRKGILDLIEAINNLNKSNFLSKYTGIKFVLAGKGECEGEIQNKIDNYNLKEYIELPGWVSGKKKNDLIRNSIALILPSYNEGLPICILEAMSLGVPVISTNVGSIEEAVINNQNGFIINPGDIGELKKSIEEILIKDKWIYMAKNAKEIAEENFSEEEYFKKITNIYAELK